MATLSVASPHEARFRVPFLRGADQQNAHATREATLR
jgi:hypothetical protein